MDLPEMQVGQTAPITMHKVQIGTIRRERANLYVVKLNSGVIATVKGLEEALTFARNNAE